MVMDSRSAAKPMLGVFLMKKTLLAGVAALFLATGAAYANTKAARHTTEQAPSRQLDFSSQIQYINPASAIDATKT